MHSTILRKDEWLLEENAKCRKPNEDWTDAASQCWHWVWLCYLGL